MNLDHIATLREARKTYEPSPVHAAVLARLGGADGITVHIRSDRRHIKEGDAKIIKGIIELPLTIEMGLFDDILDFVVELRPEKVTLVPERGGELTTEGGLDVKSLFKNIKKYIEVLEKSGVRTGIFVDPQEEQIKASFDVGAYFVEINTTLYAYSFLKNDENSFKEALREIKLSSEISSSLGLHTHAGHALNYKNVLEVVKIPFIEELSIGHSIISRAVFIGLERAVREMKDLLNH